MAANGRVKRGTNQTEKKAKGLVKGVGDYKGKTLNLTKKQLGKSGTAALQSKKVNIQSTRYDSESKKVYGPKGKALTGRVDLGGGNIGVYKNGVRVKAKAPVKRVVSRGGGGGGGGGGGTGNGNYKTAPRLGKPGQYQAGAGMTSRKPPSSGTVTSAIAQGNKMGPSGSSYKPKPKTAAQQAVSKSSGYARGVVGSQAQINAMKGKGTLKGNLAKKRAEDTRNQGRNALGIAGLAAAPFLAAGGAKLGAAALAARLGTGAMAKGAASGLQSGARYAAGQGAARGTGQAVAKSTTKATVKATAKRPKSTSKTPAWTKYGKDIKITRNARDRAQQARLDKILAANRAAAAKKAAATKRANAAKAAKARKK